MRRTGISKPGIIRSRDAPALFLLCPVYLVDARLPSREEFKNLRTFVSWRGPTFFFK